LQTPTERKFLSPASDCLAFTASPVKKDTLDNMKISTDLLSNDLTPFFAHMPDYFKNTAARNKFKTVKQIISDSFQSQHANNVMYVVHAADHSGRVT
jgi:hypothetical protein